jgi:hypothetical protein
MSIYNRNDSGLHYETTIITTLTLATIINYNRGVVIYDHKVWYKQKRALLS